MTTETKHEELRELHEAATPGPWCVENPMDMELWVVQDGKPTYDWYPLATCPWPDDGDGVPRKAVEANAALIVHLRNNAEHYIAQDTRIAELEALLRQYDYQLGGETDAVKKRFDDLRRDTRAALGEQQP